MPKPIDFPFRFGVDVKVQRLAGPRRELKSNRLTLLRLIESIQLGSRDPDVYKWSFYFAFLPLFMLSSHPSLFLCVYCQGGGKI